MSNMNNSNHRSRITINTGGPKERPYRPNQPQFSIGRKRVEAEARADQLSLERELREMDVCFDGEGLDGE